MVDGQQKGVSSPSLTVSSLAPGTHVVRVSMQGYFDASLNAVVQLGQATPVTISLISLSVPTPTPVQVPASPKLTCDYSFAAIPPVTKTIARSGSAAGVRIGFSEDFGAIATSFELVNPANGASVNVLESRSGAGSAWQYTGQATAYDGGGALINQAAGNSLGSQWGYQSVLNVNTSATGVTASAANWVPNPSDTLNGDGTSPCASQYPPAVFDLGKPSMSVSDIATSLGTALNITSTYTLQSTIDQYWKMYVPGEAIYMNRQVARDANLRMYILGPGWTEGPIRPYYDNFTIAHATYVRPVPQWGVWMITADVQYTAFVWNVGGKDVGVVLPGAKGSQRLVNNTYCSNEADYSCGSMDYGFWEQLDQSSSYPNGAIRSYSFGYLVGSVPQLEAIIGRSITG